MPERLSRAIVACPPACRRSGTTTGGLLLRGVLGFGALSAFYWSVVHLPLAAATVLQYMGVARLAAALSPT